MPDNPRRPFDWEAEERLWYEYAGVWHLVDGLARWQDVYWLTPPCDKLGHKGRRGCMFNGGQIRVPTRATNYQMRVARLRVCVDCRKALRGEVAAGNAMLAANMPPFH